MTKTQTGLAGLILPCCLAVTVQAAVIPVTDPGGLGSAINSLGTTISAEVGNYTIADFNADPRRKVFTWELGDGYPDGADGDQVSSVTVTGGGLDGTDLVLTIPVQSGGGFGRIVAPFEPTGGTQAIVYDTVTANFTFNQPVAAVGFTLNRVITSGSAGLDVLLYDTLDNQINSTFNVADNGGSGHSFFGFNAGLAGTEDIVRIEITGSLADLQYSLDDFAVVPLPEPSSFALLAWTAATLLCKRRRRADRR